MTRFLNRCPRTRPLMRPVSLTNVPKRLDHAALIKFGRPTRCPMRVKKMLLMASPNAIGMKKMPISAALAASLHLSHEEIASDISASRRIQTQLPRTIAPAILKFDANQLQPSRYDWKRKRSRIGTQVIKESRISSTLILPTTYSARENGRQR